MRYLLRRLLRALALLALASVFCFLLTDLAPGSFFDELRLNPQVSQETVAGLRAQYGLDQPVAVRYGRWLSAAVRGDLGYSLAYNAPVGPLLRERARNTLLLATTALVLAWLLAIPLGMWAAAHPRGWADRAVTAATSLVLAVPEIALALTVLALAVWSGALPAGGMTSLRYEELSALEKLGDIVKHLVVPATVLALGMMAVIVRHVRSSVREVMDAPYIIGARGHGIARSRMWTRYILPAAANTWISLLGLSVATLLSGSLAVEVITGWPGLGPLLLEATLARDPYVIVGAVMLSAVLAVLGTLLADLLLAATDPRIRLRGSHA